MRDFNERPLLTPEEAFERAWELDRNRPLFDLDYRVRNPDSWKVIETLLRQYDVDDVIIVSFGLKKLEEIVEVFTLLPKRGWRLWQTQANVYVGGELRAVQAIRAHHPGD